MTAPARVRAIAAGRPLHAPPRPRLPSTIMSASRSSAARLMARQAPESGGPQPGAVSRHPGPPRAYEGQLVDTPQPRGIPAAARRHAVPRLRGHRQVLCDQVSTHMDAISHFHPGRPDLSIDTVPIDLSFTPGVWFDCSDLAGPGLRALGSLTARVRSFPLLLLERPQLAAAGPVELKLSSDLHARSRPTAGRPSRRCPGICMHGQVR